MYDHTFYEQVQISRSDIRPHIKWAVSLVILHMVTSIFLWALCGYIWVNILTLSPRGLLGTDLAGWIVPAEKTIEAHIIRIQSGERLLSGFIFQSQGLVKTPLSPKDWTKQECTINRLCFISKMPETWINKIKSSLQ